jgi:hypothetical protein
MNDKKDLTPIKPDGPNDDVLKPIRPIGDILKREITGRELEISDSAKHEFLQKLTDIKKAIEYRKVNEEHS